METMTPEKIKKWEASLPPGMLDELNAVEREYQKDVEELAKNDQGRWPFNSSHSPERGQLYRDYCKKMAGIFRKYQSLRDQRKTSE